MSKRRRQHGNELISISEASRRIGIAVSTLWDAVQRGDIASDRVAGRPVIRSEDADRFAKNRPKTGPKHARKP